MCLQVNQPFLRAYSWVNISEAYCSFCDFVDRFAFSRIWTRCVHSRSSLWFQICDVFDFQWIKWLFSQVNLLQNESCVLAFFHICSLNTWFFNADEAFWFDSAYSVYFIRLRTLVEETYMLNGKRKVVLLSHSLGGLYATWFLNQRPQSWKVVEIWAAKAKLYFWNFHTWI